MAATGRVMFVPALPDDPELISDSLRPYIEAYGVHSAIAAPMNARGRVVGVLVSRATRSPSR